MIKNTHVDCIFLDAADRHDKMPLDTVDVNTMSIKGTYFSNQKFTDEANFVKFIESNSVFGSSLSKNFYLYTIARQYAVKLKPTTYHKRNFPTPSSMVAICQARFLIISPNPRDIEEKKIYFSSTGLNGVTLIDIDDDEISDYERYERASKETFTEKKKLQYASGDDEPVRHFTPGTDCESYSVRKRSYLDDRDSDDEESHSAKSYKTTTHTRDSAEPDSGLSSSSKSRKCADKKN